MQQLPKGLLSCFKLKFDSENFYYKIQEVALHVALPGVPTQILPLNDGEDSVKSSANLFAVSA